MSLCIGVNNLAREGDKGWIGVNNVAREIDKMWIGDENGVAREFFSSVVGKFVFFYGSSVYMSNNGTEYTRTALSCTGESSGFGDAVGRYGVYESPIYVDGKYYAVNDSNYLSCFSSEDGIAWKGLSKTNAFYDPYAIAYTMSRLLYFEGYFIIIRKREDSDSSRELQSNFLYSRDCAAWTKVSLDPYGIKDFLDIIYGTVGGKTGYFILTSTYSESYSPYVRVTYLETLSDFLSGKIWEKGQVVFEDSSTLATGVSLNYGKLFIRNGVLYACVSGGKSYYYTSGEYKSAILKFASGTFQSSNKPTVVTKLDSKIAYPFSSESSVGVQTVHYAANMNNEGYQRNGGLISYNINTNSLKGGAWSTTALPYYKEYCEYCVSVGDRLYVVGRDRNYNAYVAYSDDFGETSTLIAFDAECYKLLYTGDNREYY